MDTAASSELRTVFHINDDSGGFFLSGKCGLASRHTGFSGSLGGILGKIHEFGLTVGKLRRLIH